MICVRQTDARLTLVRWKDSLVKKLVYCQYAINAHVSRERLRRHGLWFPSDTCKGYYGTRVPSAWRVFLVCVSKVSSEPLI